MSDIQTNTSDIDSGITVRQETSVLRNELAGLYPSGEVEAIIRIIFEYLKGWKPVDIVMHGDYHLSLFIVGRIKEIVGRLKRHEPIQYIVGEARFFGCNFLVTRDTLIPRQETEELVQLVLDYAGDTEDLRVLDIATGSGCIAIALARNLRFARVTGTDISVKAIEVARENATRLKAKVDFRVEDVFSMKPEAESLDIIVSNPPYIGSAEAAGMDANVLDYEPHSALFVPDNDPLVFYKAITDYAAVALRQGGGLYFEINPLHADALTSLVENSGFTDVETTLDIHRRKRFLTATHI